jgi:hypothetical protein
LGRIFERHWKALVSTFIEVGLDAPAALTLGDRSGG